MVARLSRTRLEFPPVEDALGEPNGLLAVGGDLSPARIERAYRAGIFPWFEPGGPILWWSPDPRAILLPDELVISRSMEKRLRNGGFTVTLDTAFAQVIAACAAPRPKATGTWITNDMIAAYIQLHELGFAHSVETYLDGKLVGGLYGVSWGAAFFGESMFSRANDASKVALCHLSRWSAQQGFEFIDCQMPNPHLSTLGVREISRQEFLRRLASALARPTLSGRWTDIRSTPVVPA